VVGLILKSCGYYNVNKLGYFLNVNYKKIQVYVDALPQIAAIALRDKKLFFAGTTERPKGSSCSALQKKLFD
jgi:hypothetical protein